MHKTDYLNLDGNLLRLLVLIHETGSVTKTATRLGMNQSSASHGLERLRRIVGDPLFVRSGRGVVATARADELVVTARRLLAELEGFVETGDYDPKADTGLFRIAANDYEVETILRPLMRSLGGVAPDVTLQVLRAYTSQDWVSLLRDNEVDLVLAPTLTTAESDLVQQTLFEDGHVCVFDPRIRSAPDSLDLYCEARHAVMLPGRFGPTEIDQGLAGMGRHRSVVLTAPSFAMLAAMIEGTDIVATMPSRLTMNLFSGFDSAKPPLETKAFAIAQLWHGRNSASPRHIWFRQAIRSASR